VDMAGNVWEWTSSDYDADNKVLRGGSWDSGADLVRSASRIWLTPGNRDYDVGFRCARGSE